MSSHRITAHYKLTTDLGVLTYDTREELLGKNPEIDPVTAEIDPVTVQIATDDPGQEARIMLSPLPGDVNPVRAVLEYVPHTAVRGAWRAILYAAPRQLRDSESTPLYIGEIRGDVTVIQKIFQVMGHAPRLFELRPLIEAGFFPFTSADLLGLDSFVDWFLFDPTYLPHHGGGMRRQAEDLRDLIEDAAIMVDSTNLQKN